MATVAIIGSFRQHFRQVTDCVSAFTSRGIEVTSPPLGSEVLDPDKLFVRLSSDPAAASDPLVQTRALHRILRADVVYVVAVGGYVGPTTAYEIGRIIHSQHPLYFSERPGDLPILVPDDHVVSAARLANLILDKDQRPVPLYADDEENSALERKLLREEFETL